MDADAVLERLVGRGGRLRLSQLFLDLEGRCYCIHRTVEKHQQPVARGFESATVEALADTLDELRVAFHEPQGLGLVLLDPRAESYDVGEHDGSQSPLPQIDRRILRHSILVSSTDRKAQSRRREPWNLSHFF